MRDRDPWLFVLCVVASLMGSSAIVFRLGWMGLALCAVAVALYAWLRIWKKP